MLRKFTILLSLILTLGFAATTSAVAQDATAPDITEELEGLDSGYARMFMPDFNAMLDAIGTPGADVPEIDEDGVFTIMTQVLSFDSTDHANAAMDTAAEGFASQESAELKSEDIEDLGDKATLYSGEITDSGQTMSVNVLVAQKDKDLFLVQIIGGNLDEGATQARDIATFMLDGTISTDEVTFNEDGTSTGGAFDLMPTAQNTDLIGNLAPFMDIDMMAATEGAGN